MPRWFNIASPCNPAIHSMLPATEWLPNVERLVAQQGYWVIFDQRDGLGPISDRTSVEPALSPAGRQVTVILGWDNGPLGSAYCWCRQLTLGNVATVGLRH